MNVKGDSKSKVLHEIFELMSMNDFFLKSGDHKGQKESSSAEHECHSNLSNQTFKSEQTNSSI